MTLYPMFKTKARLCEKTEFVKIYEMTVEGTEYVIACGGLHVLWEDLAEVCSLAVREDLRKQGLGRKIVMACVDDCRILHLKKVFSLTYQAAFFERIGFHEVDKGVLPQKIWADCVHCAKYPDCDETAMFLELE